MSRKTSEDEDGNQGHPKYLQQMKPRFELISWDPGGTCLQMK